MIAIRKRGISSVVKGATIRTGHGVVTTAIEEPGEMIITTKESVEEMNSVMTGTEEDDFPLTEGGICLHPAREEGETDGTGDHHSSCVCFHISNRESLRDFGMGMMPPPFGMMERRGPGGWMMPPDMPPGGPLPPGPRYATYLQHVHVQP